MDPVAASLPTAGFLTPKGLRKLARGWRASDYPGYASHKYSPSPRQLPPNTINALNTRRGPGWARCQHMGNKL